ncbi:uncharacterized protein LOC133823736 [Humulus lupulus]|uniref:uncharacterized protein LOC133823736 n=1 Tax=Humulus lupulus TaxID=3486 RepID=UPI002B40BC2C|nr:uncharacterized protein LOC133823736 [Humulus lupulus]
MDKFLNAEAVFMSEGAFDHCPVVLSVYPVVAEGKKPFRYFRMCQKVPDFKKRLERNWLVKDGGAPMFQLIQKLKRIKKLLKEINKSEIGDIQAAHARSYQALIVCQAELTQNPLITKEKEARTKYNERNATYLSFLQQKAKLHWMKDGDDNTSLFHTSIWTRKAMNRIYSIKDMDGVWVDKPDQVIPAFLNFYYSLLGSKMEGRKSVLPQVINQGPSITEVHTCLLTSEFSNEEVKATVFEIPSNKSPGPDGFSSFFFQDNWEVVGNTVCEAVISFLHTGKLLKEINSTTLTLIPKAKRGLRQGDPLSPLLGLKLFSQTSGLQRSETKSALYCSNMDDFEVERVINYAGFTRQHLPFRYLGIPICAKRISTTECEILVEKMVQRIKVWSTRNLSYAGKATLVNSVLPEIHTYWAQIMILPTKVLQQVNTICRNFLWKGLAESSSSGQWLRKKDSLWVRWKHVVYIGDEDWWVYKAPSVSSWYWKQIVKVKEKYKDLNLTHLCSNGIYKIAEGYKALAISHRKVPWYREVWNRTTIPKHRFILWLAVLDRLQLKDRLFRFNISIDDQCLMCGSSKESRDHVFFDCYLSSTCLRHIKSWLDWKSAANIIHTLLRWIAKSRLSWFRKQVFTVALAALIYKLWWCSVMPQIS